VFNEADSLIFSVVVAIVIIVTIISGVEYYSKDERAKRKRLKTAQYHPYYHVVCPDCNGACSDDWGRCPTCGGIGFLEKDD
jgi:rubrerythrin